MLPAQQLKATFSLFAQYKRRKDERWSFLFQENAYMVLPLTARRHNLLAKTNKLHTYLQHFLPVQPQPRLCLAQNSSRMVPMLGSPISCKS